MKAISTQIAEMVGYRPDTIRDILCGSRTCPLGLRPRILDAAKELGATVTVPQPTPKAKKWPCRKCGRKSINRLYCPACHGRMSDAEGLI